MQWPHGASEYQSCGAFLVCGFRFALGAGLDWSPTRFFGLGSTRALACGAGSLGRIPRAPHHIIEVLLVPRLELPWKWRWPYGGARPYLALPLGPAWSYESRT